MMKERFKPPVAVFVLLINDKKVLLHKRHNTGWADGEYDVPSGHLEENETLTEAASRETREETGITVQPEDLEMVHTIHAHFSDYQYLHFYFMAKNFEGKPEIKEPEKCSEMTWYSLTNLPENIVPYVRQAISLMNTQNYSEYTQEKESS